MPRTRRLSNFSTRTQHHILQVRTSTTQISALNPVKLTIRRGIGIGKSHQHIARQRVFVNKKAQLRLQREVSGSTLALILLIRGV